MTLPLDPNEAPEGLVAVAFDITDGGCRKCVFRTLPGCLSALCFPEERADGHEVIFVPKEPTK